MKTIYELCLLLFTTLFINSCDTKKKEIPEPKAYKDKIVLYDLGFNSDTTHVVISWSQLESTDFVGYDLYRTEVNNATLNASNVDMGQFELLASILANGTTSYTDTDLPYSTFFKYIVVARTKASANPYFVSNFKEAQIKNKKHIQDNVNEIFHNAADKRMIVFSKGAGTLSLYDYHCNFIRKVSIPNKSLITDRHCFGAIGTFKNQPELYIPSGEVIYIYNPQTLDLIDTIDTGNSFQWSVTPYKGRLFVAGAVIDRETKEVIESPYKSAYSEYSRREFPVKNKNSNFINSFFISLGFSPDELAVNYYTDNGKYVATVNDTYHGTYPLNASLFKVSPNGLYLITDTRGAIYDYSLKFNRYLNGDPISTWPIEGPFFDFEFSADGSLIYAAMNNAKSISVYDANYTYLKSIPLNGYPVRLFRQNNEMMVAISERSLREAPALEPLPSNLYRIRFQRVKL